jgi:hypothetical protein
MKLLYNIVRVSFIKVSGTQIIVIVDLPLIFAVCTLLCCDTTERFDDLVSGFHICVNQWMLAFRNEAFSVLFLSWGVCCCCFILMQDGHPWNLRMLVKVDVCLND